MNKKLFGNLIKILLVVVLLVFGLCEITKPVYAIDDEEITQETTIVVDNDQNKNEENIDKEEKPATNPLAKEDNTSSKDDGEKNSNQSPAGVTQEDKKSEETFLKNSSPTETLGDNSSDNKESSDEINNNDNKPDQNEQDVLNADLNKNGESNNNDTVDTPDENKQEENKDNEQETLIKDSNQNSELKGEDKTDDGKSTINNNDDSKKDEVNNLDSSPTTRDVIPPTADLTNYITAVEIDAPKEGDSYVVQPNTPYEITMYFAESAQHQFLDESPLTYNLPAGFNNDLTNADGAFTMTLKDGNDTIVIENNRYTINNGVLKVYWSETDPDIGRLFSISNAKFNIKFWGAFDRSEDEINYNSNVVTPLRWDDGDSSISMSKDIISVPETSSYVDTDKYEIVYQIKIVSTGINTNVNLEDVLSGTGVTLDHSSFKVNPESLLSGITFDNDNTNKFYFHADRLSDGQEVIITYSALLNESLAIVEGEGENKRFYITANNQAKIKADGEEEITPPPKENKIEFKPYIKKVGKTIDGNKILWNISINANNQLLISDMPVVDLIDKDGSGNMFFSETDTEIIVKIYDEDGNQVGNEKRIPLSQILNSAENGWTYIIPSGNEKYRYEIEYTTSYNPSEFDTTLVNDVHVGPNGVEGRVGIPGYADIEKNATKVDIDDLEVTWEIVIHVPETGLNSNVLTDTYPTKYLEEYGHTVIEAIKEGSIDVQGLVGTETYDVNFTNDKAVFTFYKDGNHTPGLTGTGNKRDITIVFKTVINEEWLNETLIAGDRVDNYTVHQNTIKMGNKTVHGEAIVVSKRIIKSLDTYVENRTVEIDGVTYPYYKYKIVFSHIEDTSIENEVFTFEDTFDTNLFDIYDSIPAGETEDDNLVIKAGVRSDNQYIVNWQNIKKASYTRTSTGLKFTIQRSDLITKDASGKLYDYYGFDYYLIPKNYEALRTLMNLAAENNGEYTFKNKVKYKDELEDEADGTYYYNVINKTHTVEVDPVTGKETGQMDFEIEINPNELVLNNGDTLTLTDTYENLSILYDTIEIITSDDENIIYYPQGNSLIFTIPDATKVTIKYRARIIYNLDENSNVTYKNIALLMAGESTFDSKVIETKHVDSYGSGGGSIVSINIFKYEAGNMSNRLAGAVFALFDENKQPIINNKNEQATFVTGSDGIVKVVGDQREDGWTLQTDTLYYLLEITPPPGFKKDDTYYGFTIASDDNPDYSRYIYFSGDNLTVKNYPGVDAKIEVEKKLEGRNWTNNDTFEFTITAEDGTPLPKTTTITITNESTNHKGTFGPISYTAEGTYKYTIEEVHKGETINGVTYDRSIKTVTFTVVKDEEGNLVVSGNDTATISVEFTNEYETKGEAEISVIKELIGREWNTDDTFEFTITAEDGTPLPETKTITITKDSEGYKGSFGKIKYTKAGTYTYTITETHKGETVNGIVYDREDKTVTITLVDDGEGNLVPSEEGQTLEVTFKNEYETQGEAEISVIKELIGREWNTDDTFEFTITAEDGTPLPETKTITITKDSEGYKGSFGKIKYTKAGTYTYTITETHKGETVNGIVYDREDKTVTITLVDDGEGNLVPSEEGQTLEVTFKNEYETQGEAEISVIKELIGREWNTDDTFEFTITAEDGTPLPETKTITITKDSEGYKGSFGKIKYTKAGTYTYTITETHKGETVNGIVYDREDKTVTITLVDDGEGNLVPSEEGQTLEVTFKNEYETQGEAEISVIKELIGREWNTDDTFEFTITAEDGTPLPETKTITITKDSEGYKGSFGKIKYTKAGTYTYTITETHKGETVNGIVYDREDKTVTITLVDDGEGNLVPSEEGQTLEVTFKNEYETQGEAEISVIKELIGREWNTDDTFEFTITAEDGTPLPETKTITITKDSEGYKGSFGKIKYTKAGTYTYTITETHKGETVNGIVYDREDKTVTITLVDDGEGNLVPSEEGQTLEVTFKNEYETQGEAEISVIKELIGREWNTDDTFEFTITAEDGTPLPETKTITITKDSEGYKGSFGKIKYTKAGTYTYTITETHKGETVNGIVYDREDKTVTITLVDDGEGNLVPSEEGQTLEVTFKNEYETQGEAEISVIKELIGREWNTDDTFEFTITAEDGTPLPETKTITITKDSEGYKGSFGKIKYTKAGTYTYTITETHKGETVNGIVYDREDKTVTITLVDDGEGNLVPSEEGQTLEVTFKNEYETQGEAEISVIKELIGREWNTDDTFEFTITAEDGTPLPETKTITITKDSEGYKGSFGKIKYTKAGTYTYTITETHKGETVNGIVYDREDKTVTITLVDDGEGNLVPSEEGQTLEVTFKNEYETQGKAEISVIKELIGREWNTDDTFEFTITAEDGTPLPETKTITITKDSEGYKGSFGKIKYTKAGTYTYTITETHKGETVNGIVYDREDKTVTITLVDDGEGNLVPSEEGQTLEVTFKNEYFGHVSVSKVDVADGREVEGATIQLLDKDGNVIDEWLSDGKTHIVEGLNTEEEYSLKETVAPDGYLITKEITFTIDKNENVVTNATTTTDENGEIVILIEDEKTSVHISKVDVADGKELKGATIQILDSEGNVVEEWTSIGETHTVEGLKVNEEYTLKETVAPDGYKITKEITFTIDETGKVTTTGNITEDEDGNLVILVEDDKTKVAITKVDITTGEELEGAKIQVIDKDGNVVEEWTSTKEQHVIQGLKVNEEYTIKEIIAPDGYIITTDITFTIDEKGKVTTTGNITEDEDGNLVILVEDDKTKVVITKVDITTGEELEGAKIQVLDKDGNVVDEWTSTKEQHVIEGLKVNEEYTIKEIIAPDGYIITTDITFTIDETGKVTTTGSTTTDEDGNVVILIEDDKTKVVITKVDITTGEELEGAKLQVIDKDGKVVEEWVSTKEGHVIEGLKAGEEYTLKEVVAPLGYDITTDITFTIDEAGNVTTTGHTTTDESGNSVILIRDSKTPDKVPPPPRENPPTADFLDLYIMLLNLFILGFASCGIYLRKLNKAL